MPPGEAAARGRRLRRAEQYGVLYIKRHSAPQNNVRAYLWESLAAAHGNAEASKNLTLFRRAMKPAQIAQAKAMAAKCEASKYKACD
jgi:hypothetical protein